MIDFYFDTQNTRDGFLRNAINNSHVYLNRLPKRERISSVRRAVASSSTT